MIFLKLSILEMNQDILGLGVNFTLVHMEVAIIS
jgi:hypothetical protein